MTTFNKLKLTERAADSESTPDAGHTGATERPPKPDVGDLAARGRSAATQAGEGIAAEFGKLDRRELLQMVRAFRRQLIPPRAAGGRASKLRPRALIGGLACADCRSTANTSPASIG
jgi:hypothetical protein